MSLIEAHLLLPHEAKVHKKLNGLIILKQNISCLSPNLSFKKVLDIFSQMIIHTHRKYNDWEKKSSLETARAFQMWVN